MTEEEAKTKACCGPFRDRVPYESAEHYADVVKNGLHPDYVREVAAAYPCIGSACMAWRWLPQKALVASNVDEAREPFTTDRPGDYENNPSWSVERLPLHGGCGLAGAPQP